jgi:hypothetical protein
MSVDPKKKLPIFLFHHMYFGYLSSRRADINAEQKICVKSPSPEAMVV